MNVDTSDSTPSCSSSRVFGFRKKDEEVEGLLLMIAGSARYQSLILNSTRTTAPAAATSLLQVPEDRSSSSGYVKPTLVVGVNEAIKPPPILPPDLLPLKKRRRLLMEEEDSNRIDQVNNDNASDNNSDKSLKPRTSQNDARERGSFTSNNYVLFPPKPKPVKDKNKPNITFIDIESQRWWDRAHVAYTFGDEKEDKDSSSGSSSRQEPLIPPYLYDTEDPRSPKFKEWLKSYYGDGRNHDHNSTKNKLLEKLNLRNPEEEGVYPPWAQQEGRDLYDLSKLDEILIPNRHRNKMFQYD